MIRQIVGPRQVAILTAYGEDPPLIVADPAINLGESDMGAYWDSLFDTAHLVSQPNQRPTRYTIKPLTRAQKRHIPQSADVMERADWAIRFSVTAITDRPMSIGGIEKPTPQPETNPMGKLGDVATEKWLDDAMLTDDETLALYQMIRHISEASGPLSSSSAKPPGDTESCETETLLE